MPGEGRLGQTKRVTRSVAGKASAHDATTPEGQKRSRRRSSKIETPKTDAKPSGAVSSRTDILKVATRVFATRGYNGGHISEIVAKTRTSKRMIYYYFGSKEGLYRAVLLEHYRRLRSSERAAGLHRMSPAEALAALTRSTFDWYVAHAHEVPLVMVENAHQGRHVSTLPELETLNSTAIELVRSVYERGLAQGVMRPGVRPIDIYISIASASFFNISNRYTFKAIFGHDMAAKAEIALRREALVETVLRYVGVTDRC